MYKLVNSVLVSVIKYKHTTISNYNLLDETVLLADGWKPLTQDMPTYDEETKILELDNYEETATEIIAHYIAVDIPESIPTTDEVVDEVIQALYDRGVLA